MRNKVVTFYSEVNYTGLNYTLFDNRLHYCVDFTRGPLLTRSARLFHNAVCDLYTSVSLCNPPCVPFELTSKCSEQGCTIDSYTRTIVEDTPDTGNIELFSMHCTTVS